MLNSGPQSPAFSLQLIAVCIAGLAASVSVRAEERVLADPARMLSTAKRIDFVSANTLSVEFANGKQFLRSIPKRSATGLYQKIWPPINEVGLVRWRWRVDAIQRNADLRDLEREDVAAAVIFVFGEPTLLNRDVPTISYVWSATPVSNGMAFFSRRYKSMAYIKLHGTPQAGTWQTEQRDINADYRMLFGSSVAPLKYVAIFNDNDQTQEATSAVFGSIDHVILRPDR